MLEVPDQLIVGTALRPSWTIVASAAVIGERTIVIYPDIVIVITLVMTAPGMSNGG